MQINDPTDLLYGILAGTLPSLLWLWFWLKEDNLHDEPWKTLAGCFFMGMVAVFISIPFERLDQLLVSNLNYQYIGIAAIEEILKFAMVFVVVLSAQKMHEPVDAMIYMITAALGFAAAENTLFIFGIIHTGNLLNTIITGNLRFIGSTLLHVIASGSIGFMLAIAYYQGVFTKFISGAVGLALAIALHAAFDLAIINSNASDSLKIYAWVWAGVIVLIILFQEAKGVELRHKSRMTADAQ